jgi:ATP-binding cassette, subfamily B, bacterial MsbA
MYNSWKILWPFIRPYKGKLILTMILGIVLAQFSILLPVLANSIFLGFQKKTLIDDPNFFKLFNFLGISKDNWLFKVDHKTLVTYVSLSFPIYYFIYGIIRYYHFYLVKFIGEQVISDIRIGLMNKFMELDVLYLGRQKKGSGGLLSRTLNDTLILQNGLQFYADLFREPISGLFIIGYMLFINWKITLACFFFLPIFIGVIRYVSKSLKNIGYQSQESLEEVTKTLREGMDGVRVIQSFNLQETMKLKFNNQVKHYLDKRRKIIKREELGSPINEWFASVLICGVCLFQAQLIWGSEADVGSFVAFLIAAGMLDKPIKKSQQAVIYIQQNIVALERLSEVFNSNTEVVEPLVPKPFPDNWKQIEFKNVNFSYNEKPVIQNINLKINKGEIIALVGESGSGKSTLAGLLQRFYDPQQGSITIGNTPINEMLTYNLRKNIGYVTQDVFLFDDTIENNIGFGNLERDRDQIKDAAQMANATKFTTEMNLGFESNVGERGGRLSGGEKQRISIARAVFKDPPILILDEATSALDSASEQEVQKGIETLLKGRTALVIAHRLSTIVNCDRIIVMREGRIVEEGTHQSLIQKNEEYARFYKLQYS